MVDAGNANITWTDKIHFLTINTTSTRDGCQVLITQSFPLPQGQYHVTCTNGTIYVTSGYVGVGPLNLLPAMFKAIITDPTGIDVSCEMAAPGFCRSRALAIPPLLIFFYLDQQRSLPFPPSTCPTVTSLRRSFRVLFPLSTRTASPLVSHW